MKLLPELLKLPSPFYIKFTKDHIKNMIKTTLYLLRKLSIRVPFF